MVNKRLINTGGAASAAAFDSLANFETVTYTGNGSTQKITGYIRKGAAFNGSSSYISGLSTLTNISDSFSVSMWVNFASAPSTTEYIFGGIKEQGAEDSLIGIYVNTSGYIGANVRGSNSGTVYSATSTSSFADGNWHHVVYNLNSSTLQLYIDNSQIGSDVSIGSATVTVDNAVLGAINSRGTIESYFNGKIDQVRIFNKALSSGEVTTLYGETFASSTKSTTDIFNDGSGVALYELDDDANDTGIYPYGTGDIDSGQSAVFNGSSSKINTGIVLSSTTFSVSVWFKTSVTGRTIIGNFNSSASSVNDRDGFVIDAEKYIFNENDVEIFRNYYNAGNLADNNWHNIVLTNDGSNSKVYIDGTLDRTDNSTGWNTLSPQDIHIGFTQRSPIVNWFNGLIDQVRVYSSALSASDVEALVSETNVPTANLVAHYKLDGDATDETTNYNGTATSITYSDPAEFPLIAYNGTPTNVNFLGMAFQPDLVWVKCRSTADPSALVDSVRGANETLFSSETHEQRNRTSVTAFDSNGFTLGNYANTNRLNDTYVAWCWKAADTTTTISAGTVGNTIASDVRANQDAGFSIVSYTGNGSSGQTVGHGLSSAPEFIVVKSRNTVATTDPSWIVYHKDLTANYKVALHEAAAAGTTGNWSNTEPTSNGFYILSGNSGTNANGGNFIAYCFHSVDGYQKVGSYTGTGASGNTITTGFEPRFVMIKRTDAAGGWLMFDYQRNLTNPRNSRLEANSSQAEQPGSTGKFVDFDSNGFEPQISDAEINGSGNTYIYLAIA